MPFCTYCGQSFTRDEHLERHILTHTNVKPYKCFTCHMSFARRDLLHRHYTVHGKDSSQEPLANGDGMVPKSAGRTPIACHNCAKTKTKCDKKFPCTRCASRNLTCTARPTRRTPKNPALASLRQDAKARSSEDSSASSQVESSSGSNSSSSSSSSNSSSSPPGDSIASMPSPIPIRPNANASQDIDLTQISPSSESSMESENNPFDQVPGLSFSEISPLSEYDDFMRIPDGSDPLISPLSPHFTFDWQQMSMPYGYDPKSEILMSPTVEYDPNGFMHHMVDPQNFMTEFQPEFSNHPLYLQTTLDAHDYPFPLSPSTESHPSSSNCHSRSSSINSLQTCDSEPVVIARDAWSAFKCNPVISSSLCPKTAMLNLEQLEQSLKNPHAWENQGPSWDEEYSADDTIFVAPFQEMSRDRLLATTQKFLHKALDIHNDGRCSTAQYPMNGPDYSSSFIILPPARLLHGFLRSFTSGFEQFYPTISKGIFDPNQLMQGYNDKAGGLLLLLMIAQGATISPAYDGRELTAGLTEACRIALSDLIEKNIMMASDPVVLHSALLFTVQAAWSGDKWQMDIAMGQRGMYFAMLRQSGLMEPKNSPPNEAEQVDTELLWNNWVEQETNSRLVYTWAMVDQDLSLFHDTAPLFSVTEFGEPMPDSATLWAAKSASEWSSAFEQAHEPPTNHSSVGPRFRPLSLRNLFRHFLDDAIVAKRIELTPLHLRLLLHPLQSLVCQFRQLLSCFSDKTAARRGSKTVSAASTRARLEEVQMLLQRWYGLADKYTKTNRTCPLMQTNLILFHLISLNAVTNFPEVERLARRDDGERTNQQLHRSHKRCISNSEEAVFHCGQVIRHIRSMPVAVRPPWWAGAVYRATLILWTDSLASSDALAQGLGILPSLETSFAVDALAPHHPMVGRYLAKSEGAPMLTARDGSLLPINDPVAVLFYGVDVVEEGVSTRFSDGIGSKLRMLASEEAR